MLLGRVIRDLSRVTRRSYQIKSGGSSHGSSVIPPSHLEVNKYIFRTDNRLIESLKALSINVNHINPSNIRPPATNRSVEDPRASFLLDIENPNSSPSNEISEKPSLVIQDFELPPTENSNDVVEAAVMIGIRRRKMRKHKLRKLRKRMKFEWAKKKQRRNLKKEKDFQAVLLAQIKEAEKFSAEDYVAEMIEKSRKLPAYSKPLM